LFSNPTIVLIAALNFSMKKTALIALSAVLCYYANAQDVILGRDHKPIDTTYKSRVYPDPNKKPYTWGVGAKFQPAALSLKWYSKSGDAVEVLISRYNNGSRGTALLEISPGLSQNGNFRLLVGPGLHMSVIERKYLYQSQAKNPAFGGDGIIGFELTAPKAHLAFQLDYQPSFDFNGNGNSYSDWGGLVIRYIW
jgi:hypothetical protein